MRCIGQTTSICRIPRAAGSTIPPCGGVRSLADCAAAGAISPQHPIKTIAAARRILYKLGIMKNVFCALFIMSAIAVSALSAAGSVDGSWVGQLPGDSGAQAIQITIRVDETGVGGQLTREGAGETAMNKAAFDGSVLT